MWNIELSKMTIEEAYAIHLKNVEELRAEYLKRRQAEIDAHNQKVPDLQKQALDVDEVDRAF